MTALVAKASNPITIIPIRFDLIHSPTLQCKVYCGVAPCASSLLLIGLAPWLCRFQDSFFSSDVMRAQWSREELKLITDSSLHFTGQQAEAIRAEVSRRNRVYVSGAR